MVAKKVGKKKRKYTRRATSEGLDELLKVAFATLRTAYAKGRKDALDDLVKKLGESNEE